MRHLIISAALAALCLTNLPAQTANPKIPQVKSQKEGVAVQAVFAAPDADARIAAAKDLITKFSDTQFKPLALYFAAEMSMQKGDTDGAVLFAEQTLEADPKFFAAMLQIGQVLASRTREFDLDKEEKLTRAEKYANEAMGLIEQSIRMNSQMTDEQFTGVKKDFQYKAYEILGMSASVRKKYDVCITQFTAALGLGLAADPATLIRMGECQLQSKKYDEAIASFDKALADPAAVPVIKKAATDFKLRASQLKAADAKK
jgi:tetratricopeptide (TPR) repeat protein